MICLSSDGRLFGLNPQFLFDIFVFFANIFILLILRLKQNFIKIN